MINGNNLILKLSGLEQKRKYYSLFFVSIEISLIVDQLFFFVANIHPVLLRLDTVICLFYFARV